MKTNKSFTKRLKATKNGKLIGRKPGQNHFNAKDSGNERTSRRKASSVSLSAGNIRRFLPGVKTK